MGEKIRTQVITILGIALCFYTLHQTNFPSLQVVSTRAIFVMLGMVLCFLMHPSFKWIQRNPTWKKIDLGVSMLLAIATVACCGWVVIQSESRFESLWLDGQMLLNRDRTQYPADIAVAVVGTLLVLECTRRAIGVIVPALALVFVFHALLCWLIETEAIPYFPVPFYYDGRDPETISLTAFYHGSGIFGVAADVMFRYVFLFVIFGAFLQLSGATQFIIDFAERVFGRSAGGPAKVSVLGSGLMGSLSGSAVANAVTTGAFTIPMMRNAGFGRETAGGITAAAASGGALVPPVMGAGAYMMLELVDPQVNFQQIASAAVIPSVLYYFSLLMIVHFYSRKIGTQKQESVKKEHRPINAYDGLVFFSALAALILLLFFKFTPFKAVSIALVVILIMTAFRSHLGRGDKDRVPLHTSDRLFVLGGFAAFALVYLVLRVVLTDAIDGLTSLRQVITFILDISIWGMLGFLLAGIIHPTWRKAVVGALARSSKNGVSLVAASACVGIIIALVDQTGMGNDFSAAIKGVVQEQLLVALIGIMLCSIILGMGVPSVVCYLLMATLMGAVLSELGVIPLAAHFFIFYFGMMSMVTPPVALAAYASASIAESKIMSTAIAAFRFSLVGFTLPYMFVYRPSLLLMNEKKWDAWLSIETKDSAEALRQLEVAQSAWPEIPALLIACIAAVVGILALAAGIAGYFRNELSIGLRILFFAAAAMLLIPEVAIAGRDWGLALNIAGAVVFVVGIVLNGKRGS